MQRANAGDVINGDGARVFGTAELHRLDRQIDASDENYSWERVRQWQLATLRQRPSRRPRPAARGLHATKDEQTESHFAYSVRRSNSEKLKPNPFAFQSKKATRFSRTIFPNSLLHFIRRNARTFGHFPSIVLRTDLG